MNKFNKMTVKLAALTQILAIMVLAACASAGTAAGTIADITEDTTSQATFCHATGDTANPYEEITVTNEDIYPVPMNGCPVSPVAVIDGKITICHATSDETNPYEEITVSVHGLDGHGTHEGDIIPMPEEGCPASLEASSASGDGKITICHATSSETNPYNEITVSVNGLNGHDKHEGDIIPMPEEGCPITKP